MISLFRKCVAPPLVSTGILACLSIFAAVASAQPQVATRTQLSAQRAAGGVLSFTAKVGGAAGESVSEGSVSFETEKGSLGSVFVVGGSATLNLTNPPQWARSVTAVYHGDAAFASSTASTAVTPDQSGLPGFTVTASPSSLTLPAGQYGNVNLTITSQNGFSEAVNLSCSGLPGAATCNFNPGVATPPANGSTISAMQITTQARSGKTSQLVDPLPGRGQGSGLVYAVLIPGVLALAGVGAIRRRNFGVLRVFGLVMLLGAGALGLSSCAARYSYLHYPPSPNFGTAAGNYTILISAYSSNGTAITQATSSDSNCAGAVCVALTVQ
jgi:Bacterial Ig-like domain (group 3)